MIFWWIFIGPDTTKRQTREELGLFHLQTPHDPTTFHLLHDNPPTTVDELDVGRKKRDDASSIRPVTPPPKRLMPVPEKAPRHPYRGSRTSLSRKVMNQLTKTQPIRDTKQKVSAYGSYNAESKAWQPTSDVTSKSYSDFEFANRVFNRENTIPLTKRHPGEQPHGLAFGLRMRREQTVPLLQNKQAPAVMAANRIQPHILSRNAERLAAKMVVDDEGQCFGERLSKSCDNSKHRLKTTTQQRRRGREATWLPQTQPKNTSTLPVRCFPIMDSVGNPPVPKFSAFSMQVRREATREILVKTGMGKFPRYSSLRGNDYF